MRILSRLHRSSPALRTIVTVVILVLAGLTFRQATVRSEEPPVFAITNARIIPVSAPAIESGTVVVRGSLIESVGAGSSLPPDARVIDAHGMWLYPGLIDSLSDIGVEEAGTQATPAPRAAGLPPSGQPSAPSQGGFAADEKQGLTPYVQAADIFNPASRKIAAARAAGITTALVAPRSGFFRGQNTLVNLNGTSPGKMVVKTPVFMHVGLTPPGRAGSGYPSSLMGVIAFIKQTFLDALHYEAAWSIYRANAGVDRPEYSRALEALQPVLKQQIAMVLPGDTQAQIQRSLDLAATYKLNMILAGGLEAGKIGAVLAERKVPVLLSAKFPERERDGDPELEEELASLRRRVEAPANAAALAAAGVRFAFQSDDMPDPKDFIRNVSRTIEAGLDKAAALRALTLTPAEILGVSDKLGSIARGKCANLVLATGDIFDARTRVRFVFIDGLRFEIPETEPSSALRSKSAATGGVAGTWSLHIEAPRGPLQVTLRLQQAGSSLTGTVVSPLGSTDIEEGTFDGGVVRFKANLNPSERFVVVFDAKIENDSMSGFVDAGVMGKFGFKGSKSPS